MKLANLPQWGAATAVILLEWTKSLLCFPPCRHVYPPKRRSVQEDFSRLVMSQMNGFAGKATIQNVAFSSRPIYVSLKEKREKSTMLFSPIFVPCWSAISQQFVFPEGWVLAERKTCPGESTNHAIRARMAEIPTRGNWRSKPFVLIRDVVVVSLPNPSTFWGPDAMEKTQGDSKNKNIKHHSKVLAPRIHSGKDTNIWFGSFWVSFVFVAGGRRTCRTSEEVQKDIQVSISRERAHRCWVIGLLFGSTVRLHPSLLVM